MAGQLDAHPFREQGFCVVRQEPDSMKVVRGRCEVHIRIVKDGAVLEIPVMKFPGQKGASEALMSYLLERNGTMDGPGFFGFRDDCIYYRAFAGGLEGLEKLALKMQQTVEKLGPKVLNVAQQ
ncbi:MAG: hypothetical protein WBL52_02460 [Bacillota bacterium]|jgi:hypothetical protein|nr:hypothetical protein [Candidatus Fermentithermobacillaceae bacterium]HAF66472.1 hypothetical protein [Clostridiales bacterium UBA9857]HOA71161.1 hypothetical protein [Bacillota bacterium]HOP71358.1 hypothetical protein [Bacillota bacterium]HPT35140.1 hypothetical protein [Bacillota bacterium]